MYMAVVLDNARRFGLQKMLSAEQILKLNFDVSVARKLSKRGDLETLTIFGH